MKRPLLFMCLCVIFLAAAGMWIGWIQPDEKLPSELAGADEIIISARISYKDSEKRFLSSVVILRDAADLRQTFPNSVSASKTITNLSIPSSKDPASSLDPVLIPVQGKLIISDDALKSDTPLYIGQKVLLKGKFLGFSHATNPGEADFADYYASMRICGRLKDVSVLWAGDSYSHVAEWLFGCRCRWKEHLYRIFPDREAAVMSAVLVGDRTDLDRELKDLYQRNGIIHILSISGLHITVIAHGLNRLLRRLGMPVWAAAGVSGLLLLAYGTMVGMGISVLRAVGMYLVKLLAAVAGRTYDMPTALGLLAALMVLFNPMYLKNAGFWLSFGAAGGVAGIYGSLFGAEQNEKKMENSFKRICRVFLDHLKQSILVSLSVSMAMLPILLLFYYEVPTLSVLVNMIVVPLMSVLLVTGILTWFAPVQELFCWLDCGILKLFEKICLFLDKMPWGTWNPGYPGKYKVLGYYLALAAGVAIIRRFWGTENRAEKEGRRIARRNAAFVIFLTILVSIMAFPEPHGAELYFLDVGQGDGIVLRTKHNRVYLFDFGSTSRNEVGNYVLKPFLKYKGIHRIDVITVSHEDADHVNGILELLKNREEWGISVGEILLPNIESMDFAGLFQILSESVNKQEDAGKTIKVSYIEAGTGWNEDGISFLCLHPDTGGGYDGANAASACYLADIGGVRVLFTGDVEKEGEKELTQSIQEWNHISGEELQVDILKVPHHGSRFSSGEEFLKLIRPVSAVISCGRNNRYGHPHAETLERLQDVGSQIFDTAKGGAVTVRFYKGSYRIEEYLKKNSRID